MAARLWAAAVTLAETYDEGRAPAQAVSATVVQRVADEIWMERFVACFEALARRLEGGNIDATRITTCTAEEMALHLVIDAAEGATGGDRSLATDLSLPARPDRDEDFDAIREIHFRDHDVLLLFDASLDGNRGAQLGAR